MRAEILYRHLEKDFINSKLTDDWTKEVESSREFITVEFRKRSMGLVCDFAREINKVYTAVFPSYDVMKKIVDVGETGCMLFVHHPAVWDIRLAPNVYIPMSLELLKIFKERRISIYNLHVPLDNYGDYSTSYSLAKGIGIEVQKPFNPYNGGMAGVIGATSSKSVQDLTKAYEKAVGHKVKAYIYGDDKIKGGKVAVIAGGGNDAEALGQILEEGINTFVTGVTALNPYSKHAHDFAKANKINILGGTHYSSEKFACIALCEYFKRLGLDSEFIEDKPVMEDL